MCRGGRVMNRTGSSLIHVRARIGAASQFSSTPHTLSLPYFPAFPPATHQPHTCTQFHFFGLHVSGWLNAVHGMSFYLGIVRSERRKYRSDCHVSPIHARHIALSVSVPVADASHQDLIYLPTSVPTADITKSNTVYGTRQIATPLKTPLITPNAY